jgi:hypothetical protein
MSRENSEFLSGFGTAFQIFKAISDAVLAAGGNDNNLRQVLSDKNLVSKIANLIVGERNVFRVVVDYGQVLVEMIQAGKYDWINNDITSDHFPITGTGQKEEEITLFHFNRSISSDDAIVEMAKKGFRPADPPEILALGAEHPELQKQFPIVALGSPWRDPGGLRHVVYLDRDDARRPLDLVWFERDWIGDWRFAAVRK